MIKLTRRNNHGMFLNPDLIETIEETPDTVITLTNGHCHLVCESASQIIDGIVEFKASVLQRASARASEARNHEPDQSNTEFAE